MPVEGKYLTNIFNGFPINICCSVRARVPYQVGNTRGVLELRFDKKKPRVYAWTKIQSFGYFGQTFDVNFSRDMSDIM